MAKMWWEFVFNHSNMLLYVCLFLNPFEIKKAHRDDAAAFTGPCITVKKTRVFVYP